MSADEDDDENGYAGDGAVAGSTVPPDSGGGAAPAPSYDGASSPSYDGLEDGAKVLPFRDLRRELERQRRRDRLVLLALVGVIVLLLAWRRRP